MALSGLDIYKLLPKTNCKECGFATCLAFAMQLAKKAVSIDKCPYLSAEAKSVLETASQPPIKLVSFGSKDNLFEAGDETVMFRHEEKFRHPCGLGFIIEDSLTDTQIKQKLDKINQFKFERVGQELKVDIVAIKQTGSDTRFIETVKIITNNTPLALVFISDSLNSLKEALNITKDRKSLVYNINEKNINELYPLIKETSAAIVVSSPELEKLSTLTVQLNKHGVNDVFIDTGLKNIADKLWDLTQIRRQALKKANRSLGYPVIAITKSSDPYEEAIEAATYISKYAGIVLISSIETWQVLSLLTLRQNIYTDPQKPLQIEPKLYSIGNVNPQSPVLITTNFSLTYYTVLGEVEASRIPSYIVSVDTEGMSVLTAWAAEKFTAATINEALKKFALTDTVSHKRLIIPGYVAVMSGDLQEQSGYEIIVGPKEAAGIPSFLKNLS
jgi:acetyl-CoA decarbonylase/synthase complex subunit gamma